MPLGWSASEASPLAFLRVLRFFFATGFFLATVFFLAAGFAADFFFLGACVGRGVDGVVATTSR